MQCACVEMDGKVVSLCGAHEAAAREARKRMRDKCERIAQTVIDTFDEGSPGRAIANGIKLRIRDIDIYWG